MRLFRFVLALAVLGRLNLAPLTISVGLLGALTATPRLPWPLWLGLVGLGLGVHFFGFGLNDLIDHPIDRTLAERQHHPLTTGQLSRRAAWGWVVGVGAGVGLGYVGMGGPWAGCAALGISGALSMVYNRWSKWGALPRWLAELALALAVGVWCLAGAWLLGFSLHPQTLSVALALSFLVLLLNSVASGLKDLATDAAFGAQSFVLATGSTVQPGDTLHLTPGLRRYAVVLQIALFLAGLGVAWAWPPIWWRALLIVLLGLYGALHLRLLLNLPTFSALRRSLPLLSGYYNYVALLWFLFDRWPLWVQLGLGLLTVILLLYPWQLAWRVWRVAGGR